MAGQSIGKTQTKKTKNKNRFVNQQNMIYSTLLYLKLNYSNKFANSFNNNLSFAIIDSYCQF